MENWLPIFGVIFGVLVGYFLAAFNNKASKGQIENELRQQISQKDAQIRALQEKEVASASAVSTAVSVQKSSEEQLSRISEKYEASQGQLENLKSELNSYGKSLATALADLEASRNLLKDKEALYAQQQKDSKEAQEKAISDLRDVFKALSSDALKQNAPEFLRLANESFLKFQETAKGDLAQRQEAISGLIKPLEEQLKVYQSHLQQSESSQTKVLGEIGNQLSTLTKQSESLADETERFRMVLKSNQARGKWGEETLRRVVEAAGMSVHCDFEEQTQVEDKKPDMIVRLPGDRVIIVDSKVPDLDFITALETADLEKRQQYLKAHASKLKDTIRQLADRDYPSQFPNSLDHVVLFLPAESLFSAALEGDEDLITWAASKKIMLATPASLIALLRSVSISWQQFTQTRNVQAIADAAQELYARVVKFTEHFEKVGQSLSKAKDAFNDALGNYEKRIKPSGEKLIELGLKTDGKEMADIKDIDGDLRLPPAI
jgi:DNA recombination protein RmuC